MNLLIPTCQKVEFGYLVPEVFPRCSRRKWLIGGLAVGNLYKYLSWSSESVVSCPFGALAGDVWFQSRLSFIAVMCMCLLASLVWA